MQFWLGSHKPQWLRMTDVPLMISHRRLRERRTLPRALGPWVLDSGAFSEINAHGRWTVSPEKYLDAIARYAAEIGNLTWAAPQDWMCEPSVLKLTGLDVTEHQRRSTASVVELREHSVVPIIPVLQGWETGDYVAHVSMYAEAGIDLEREPVVGLGSVCRRSATKAIVAVVDALPGLALHGFGLKRDVFSVASHLLASADSMAWSYRARRADPLPGCTHPHCNNCLRFALKWRAETLAHRDDLRLL